MMFKFPLTTSLTLISALMISSFGYADNSKAQMQQLTDDELRTAQGQALLNLSYMAPTDSGNFEAGSNVGFYKLGLEAEMELNANIKKLQLGCGGVNGAGGCDIDIDNLSLSGGDGSTREGRASTSAILTNPFIQFAIRNPESAATREVVGLRLSAEHAKGLLTLGDSNSDTPNGINTFSGYMNIASANGIATTASRSMTYADTNAPITGVIRPTIIGIPTIPLNFSSNDYNLTLSSATAPLTTDPFILSGNRQTSAQLTGKANVGQIDFAGELKASVPVLLFNLNLTKQITGNITGLTADVTVDEDLGFIHKINVNNPFSLSLQNQKLHWPGADAAAEKGWWMAFDDQIDIGSITPSNQVQITNFVLQQVVPSISNYLTENPVECGALNCVFGSSLDIGNVNLNGTSVDFPLANLKLGAQTFAPNCYGNLTFC